MPHTYGFVSVVVLDLVPMEEDSSFVLLNILRRFRVLRMSKIHKMWEHMSISSVIFLVELLHLRLYFLEVPGWQVLNLRLRQLLEPGSNQILKRVLFR